MIIKHPVYQGLMQLLVEIFPQHKLPLRKRIAGFLMGMFASQSVVLNRMAGHLASLSYNSVLEESCERGLRRTLGDRGLSWRSTYIPFFKHIVRFDQPKQGNPVVYLVIDETCRKGAFRILTAAVVCDGRCVPVAWVVWRGWQKKKTGFFWRQVKKLLDKASCLLNPEAQVIVLGDRAFGNAQFTDLVEEKGYEWVVRLQRQTCFVRQDSQVQLQEILSKPGFYKAYGKLFKKAGWREASLVCRWKKGHKDAMFLGSSLSLKWNLVNVYKKRALIECLFRDWKLKGWDWEASCVEGFHQHERQILLMAMATLMALSLGQQKAREHLQRSTNCRRTRPYEAKASLFRMGLERFRGYLYQTRKFPKQWELHISTEQTDWSEQISQRRAKSGQKRKE